MKRWTFLTAILIAIFFIPANSFGQGHFVTAYTGFGQEHMNINVVEAKIGGIALEAGDEIAVFDGTICCGKVILTQPILFSNPNTFVSISASKTESGLSNGFTEGNSITLKFWDSSKRKEMSGITANFINTSGATITAPKYTVGASSFVKLSVAALPNQTPVSNAGIDQSVNEGSIGTLNGSGSSDPDYDALKYTWTAPAGITLSSNTAAKPTFTAPQVSVNTNYTFSLVVNDGTINSVADQIIVTVNHVNQPSGDKIFGYTEVYSGTSAVANRRAMPLTFNETGEIQSITIYHNGGTGNVLLGVYSDISGLPTSQVGAALSTLVNTSAGWQTVELTNPVPVKAGQTLWLSWVFQNSVGVRYTAGTPGRAQSTETWSSGIPSTFGTSTILGNKFSIYCTYTPKPLFGNTEIYVGVSAGAYRRAMPVTFNETGEIQSISLYHNGGTGNVLLGVYSDKSGLPSFQLGVTTAAAVHTAAGWQTVSLMSPVKVAAGQTLWLSWVFQNSVGVRYMAGTPGRAQSSATWSSGMPATFGTAGTTGNKFSIYCTYTTKGILGNSEIYDGLSEVAYRRAMPITFSEEGVIQSISIYHNGGTGNVLLGVYSDVSGLPSAKLGVTSSTVVNTTAGWQTVSLTSPVTVTAGQTIWLSWVFQNSVGVRYMAGTPGRAQSSATWSTGMPSAFGTAAILGNKFSIYCTYTHISSDLLKSVDFILGNEPISHNSTEVLVYPNPTQGIVHIKFINTPEANSWITVFDRSGRFISKIQVEGQEQSIELKGNPPGIYLIRIDQKQSKTYKVVLQ